jgi:hypothetical protein
MMQLYKKIPALGLGNQNQSDPLKPLKIDEIILCSDYC